ncbi:imidazole glycerol phosphate synthase subunit HisF [Terribacillus saccharophilus]|uniref:imidazole glycerol phosphate synthase subunit HisF n=1 Tax=Terribacillus saccharophilus TaxID=361277 RepID=UPI002989D401|nr:imidazole glycerol phosphate synthase subunit HisF [Terribacillus saccharophilus]MCM3224768.1 imidazole glycerol phosphate synthase subunit HisF [Terribacillus saccharophilus]MEC0283330.1 imidazole glycerol phosphate synthase subunit HisF [Terribacillus saccharophilus]MEC0290286.1 imidazole glycerol phosphate synthase subunit HisF [Terribacillus saccharophilus]
MIAKRIIPCLDVKDGTVVKGTNFVSLRELGDPVAMAAAYSKSGADEIVFLDISATHEGRATMMDIVRQTALHVFVPFTVGGGVRTIEDMKTMLQAGADKVAVNSAAVVDPELITKGAEKFGSQCIVVAIDAKRFDDGWHVVTHGGRKDTGIDAIEWAKEAEARGAGEILLTSMDADGVKTGYDLPLTKAIVEEVRIPVIASGGCGSPEHITEVFQETDVSAALAASIFHDKTFSIEEVKQSCQQEGVRIREA